MRSETEIKKQIAGVRDRVTELSGFWLGEGAAMVYVLEWALGKRETAPAGELGRSGGDSEKIAANLAKLTERVAARATASKSSPKTPSTKAPSPKADVAKTASPKPVASRGKGKGRR